MLTNQDNHKLFQEDWYNRIWSGYGWSLSGVLLSIQIQIFGFNSGYWLERIC